MSMLRLAFVTLIILLGLGVAAKVCYFGQEPDPSQRGRLRWVMSGSKIDHCACTSIRPGPLNTMPLKRPHQPFYTDTPLFTEDPEEINDYLDCHESDCHDFFSAGYHASGVYTIYPYLYPNGLEVYCDMTEWEHLPGGWIVFQRRQDGSVNFTRNWTEYSAGFGNLTGEFWLGNDVLRHLTSEGMWGMGMEVVLNDLSIFVLCTHFRVMNDYRLSYRQCELGNNANFLKISNGRPFSTYDNDNDAEVDANCANLTRGGWWFDRCLFSDAISWGNLNGEYSRQTNHRGIRYVNRQIVWSTMMLRRYYPEDCEDWLLENGSNVSGVYTIYPSQHPNGLEVYCDMDTAREQGWIVFQRRKDGSVNFTRAWDDYKQGFGNLTEEFWLGNEKLHRLVSEEPWTLRIDLRDDQGTDSFWCRPFHIKGNMYNISNIKCNRNENGDCHESSQDGPPFSTYDRDNDYDNNENCANILKGGWWFGHCISENGGADHFARRNLNGEYFYPVQNSSQDGRGIRWAEWETRQIKWSEMKLRRC